MTDASKKVKKGEKNQDRIKRGGKCLLLFFSAISLDLVGSFYCLGQEKVKGSAAGLLFGLRGS